jgi:hypothetical protein
MYDMKVTRTITLDSELIKEIEKDIDNLSGWINNKLHEYFENSREGEGKLATVNVPLYPEEVEAILNQRAIKEEATRKGEQERERKAEEKLQRIRWITDRRNQIYKEKHQLKPAIDGTFDELFLFNMNNLMKEDRDLLKELEDLKNER